MRRSAAPSQSSSLKRPRFCSPVLKKTTSDGSSVTSNGHCSSSTFDGHERSPNEIIDLIRNKTFVAGCNISKSKKNETHCGYKTSVSVSSSELSPPARCKEGAPPVLSANKVVSSMTARDHESTNCDRKHKGNITSLSHISCSQSDKIPHVTPNCDKPADGNSACARPLLEKLNSQTNTKQEEALSSNEDKAFKKANGQSTLAEISDDSNAMPNGIPARPKFCTPKMKGVSFRSPLAKLSNQHSVSNMSKEENVEPTSEISCYYNVMWCKLSKKKHKKWEGDGGNVILPVCREITSPISVSFEMAPFELCINCSKVINETPLSGDYTLQLQYTPTDKILFPRHDG